MNDLIISFTLLVFLLSSYGANAQELSIVRFPEFDSLQPPSLQTELFGSSRQIEETLLLQEYGNVDDVKSFLFSDLPEGLSVEDIEFIQSSSNENVLSINGTDNILVSSVIPGTVNVSCTFSFDEMVGTTEYILTLTRRATGEIIDSTSVLFTIAGVTFYKELTPGNVTVVSGEGRAYSLPYQVAMEKTISDEDKIRCFIQFPDGTSTSGSLGGPLPHLDTLQFSVSDVSGELTHNGTECDSRTLGTYSTTDGIQLPPGCGYGLYSDIDGSLRFGILYNPYRIGNFSIHVSWSGLTSGSPQLSSEVFQGLLNIFITGSPPVVIMDVIPNNPLLRPEGGEYLKCEIINSEWRDISYFRLQVSNVTEPFSEVQGSYYTHNFTQEVSFITKPGFGTDLTWEMEYSQHSNNTSSSSFQKAIFMRSSDSTLSYDNQSLKIDSMSPDNAPENGGIPVTIHGYFPKFDADLHGIFFSGTKLDRQFISSIDDNKITIVMPPRSKLGESFEFLVTIQIGNAVSNGGLFSFILTNAVVRISQSGTSQIEDDIYRVGDCTPVRFTAIVQPYANQIQSYHWSLLRAGNTGEDAFSSTNFSYVNSSAQTIALQPDSFNATLYILRVEVTLLHSTIWEEISLLRAHVVSIGAFILQVPKRTISSPDVPLRLSAIVEPPGDCYNGNQTMIFEWDAFGAKQQFSSANATGALLNPSLTTTPTRLGWEFVIQREQLSYGIHDVSFKVWMLDQENIAGYATTKVVIERSPLVALIRHGEKQMTVNRLSSINIFGTSSYDPDVIAGDQFSGLTYEWSCNQSSASVFSVHESVPCAAVFLPSSTVAEFVITSAVLESQHETKFLQYNLTIRKDVDRVSSTVTLLVKVQDGGSLPILTDFSFNVMKANGLAQNLRRISYFEPLVISVTAPPGVSWSYELTEPKETNFFAPDHLIQNPDYFSLEASSLNTKPLGIVGNVLRPYTTYVFTIHFDASAEYEATSVLVELHTIEAPVVNLLPLPISNGTSDTLFTATAGIPSISNTFSYYFILSDSTGSEFCIGGCTGFDIVHFRVGRPGEYSLSVYVFDMQGKALLASQNMSQTITITGTVDRSTTLQELQILFEQGNDNAWTQLAHDTALNLLESQAVGTEESGAQNLTSPTELTEEELLVYRMKTASEISIGARRIFCSSFPNTYHGINGMLLTSEVMKQSILDEETVYNSMNIVNCCVKNTPARTMNSMGPHFPSFLENLNRLAKNIGQGGNSRRRLRQIDVAPANLYADTQAWTAEPFTASVVSGKLGGFNTQIPIGSNGEYGEYSVVVASNDGHMPTKIVNGLERKVVLGPSDDELFYAKEQCLLNIFSLSKDEKRFLVLHTTENFLLYGFQDPPVGSNLADRLYWAKIFKEGTNGELVAAEVAKENPCFCWRLPVVRRREFLADSLDFMPGMFSVSNLKKFGVDVSGKGEAYTYVYEGTKTSEYNATEGWVEACNDESGLVSSTLVSKKSSNAIAEADTTILGFNGTALVGLIIGGLLFIIAAVVSSWLYATTTVTNAIPTEPVLSGEMYVERDIFGRGNTMEVNADSAPQAPE